MNLFSQIVLQHYLCHNDNKKLKYLKSLISKQYDLIRESFKNVEHITMIDVYIMIWALRISDFHDDVIIDFIKIIICSHTKSKQIELLDIFQCAV